jgi:tetratricopeptide (TPR) repeat protein
VGTCFQVAASGVLATAWHVLLEAGAAEADDIVQVDGLPAGGAAAAPATVVQFDAVHDVAVLRRAQPLPDTAAEIASSDDVAINAGVVVTGHAVLDDPSDARPVRYLNAPGVWAGGTTRGDAVPLGRLSAPDLLPGMSGAPVVRVSDGAVVGVVSARYNSADEWMQHSVWVARTEDLVPLLTGIPDLAGVDLVDRSPLTGAARLLLTVNDTTVRLTGASIDVSEPHGGIRPGLLGALDDVRRARTRATAVRGKPAAESTAVVEPGTVSMRRAGALLGDSFLPGTVADALGGVLRRAEAGGMPLQLGIEAAGVLTQLPWEALPDPVAGVPLALHRLVTMYRIAPAPAAPRPVPGPLTIVVAIAAPSQGGSGVLDYERELRQILKEVRGARAGDARVRIVPFATTTAIRAALKDGDVHVLHLSGHGGPGVLELEDEQGAARPVTAEQFLTEAVPAGCMPAVIALAACYTDAPSQATAASFAAELAAHGAAAVIGTETSVTDRYSTRVFARVYSELARARVPDVVGALADARRMVQTELAVATDRWDQAVAGLDEWAVITVLAGSGTVAVFDPAAPRRDVEADGSARRRVGGLLARDPGEFVGRRAEQRTLPRILAGDTLNGVTYHGVVLRGIGGVGKTTLAAEVLRRTLEIDPNRLLVTVAGATSVDGVFGAIVPVVRRALLRGGIGGGPAMQALDAAARLDVPWHDRWELLREDVLDDTAVVLVLDNFEDNLDTPDQDGQRPIRDPALAEFLAGFARDPGRARLLVTTRYPLLLPGGTQALLDRPLGPLTEAETIKLVWALPRLDNLDDEQIEHVWRVVGGHPRTLEYLDALLGGGQARFPDITKRLSDAVERRLGAQAGAWLRSHRTLDAALADAVIESAADVLLPDLLTQLTDTPGAHDALLGLSVYRQPVDGNAVLFQLGEADPDAAWTPDRQAAQDRITTALNAHGTDEDTLTQALTTGDTSDLPTGLIDEILGDLQELNDDPRPGFTQSDDLNTILQALAASSLLSIDPEQQTVFVHRWTADELTRLWAADPDRQHQLHHANQQAADYWQWRVKVWPQDRYADVADWIEARHHLLAAEQLDDASRLTEYICSQLQHWGAWDEATALINDTLPRLPPDHPSRAVWIHQLGMLAQLRGDYADAERLYQEALDIKGQRGDQAGASKTYHQLGMLAQERGNYPEAERLYRQSLDIDERRGDQAGVGKSYHQLGILAQDRGDYPEAERLYQQSLDIDERRGDQAGVSDSYGQLGILAYLREDYQEAEQRYRQALDIKKQLGDQAGVATTYHQLGNLAYVREDYPEAERRYRQSLDIKERLGDQAGAARTYHQLGNLAYVREDYPEAERRYRQALDINQRLGDRPAVAVTTSQLGFLASDRGQPAEAVRFHLTALSARAELDSPDVGTDVRALHELRRQLGAAFEAAVLTVADEQVYGQLTEILDEFASSG